MPDERGVFGVRVADVMGCCGGEGVGEAGKDEAAGVVRSGRAGGVWVGVVGWVVEGGGEGDCGVNCWVLGGVGAVGGAEGKEEEARAGAGEDDLVV